MKDHHFLPKWIRAKGLEIILGIVCTVFILLSIFFNVPILNSLISQVEEHIYDQMIRLDWHQHDQNPKVVIIDIDDSSVQQEGRWPWPRDKMARLINQLKQDGVVTIALDIVMAEAEINYALGLKDKLKTLTTQPTDTQKNLLSTLDQIALQVDNDKIFAQALRDHNVVLSYLFHNEAEVKKETYLNH